MLNVTNLEELRDTADALAGYMRNLSNQTKSITGRAQAAGRDLTADEASRVDSLMAQFNATEAELRVARDDLAAAEREAINSVPQPRRAGPNPIAAADGRRSTPQVMPAVGVPRTFAAMYAGRRLDDPLAGRFSSLGEFALAVATGNDERLIRNATMTTTVGSEGGFAVPLQFFGPILDAALAMETIRPRANVIPMVSKQGVAGVFDYADHTSGKRAGLQLLWGPEATAFTEQRGKLREVTLNAHKGNIFVRVSNELANDAPSFDAQLSRAMVAAVASGLDLAFYAGTGAGQPMGLLNAPTLVTVSKEGSQAADTIYLQNLAKMVGRLAPASYAQSIWMVHPTCVPQLYLMSYTVKNVAGTENVGGTAAQAITVGADGSLAIFGRPVVVSEACSPVGDLGDIMLADLSKYLVGLRADATIKKDESRYFDSDEIAFRLTLRVDGQPQDAAATTLRDGTNTVSPFVTLEAR